MAKIDLSHIPLFDNHAHPFPYNREKKVPYERHWILTGAPQDPAVVHSTILFEIVNKRLRKLLDLPEDYPVEKLAALRMELQDQDRKAYIDRLWSDVGYTGMVADIGCPISKNLLTKEELADFDREMEGYTIRKINRLEWAAEDVLETGTHSFEEFTELYEKRIREKVETEGLIGLKSIVAYKTGLQIRVASEKEAKEGYYLYLSDPANKAYEKMFRDYCVCKGAEVAGKMGLPLQIHTAIGDAPSLNLQICRPAHLYDLINAYPETTFVLIHGGYPYCEEYGMMVAHYANVYGDASAVSPYAGIGGKTKIRELLSMIPTRKLMFGTDAGGCAEQFWIGAVLFRKYFAAVLEELLDDDLISYDFAMEAAENIMHKNAKRLYKIEES